MAKLLVFDEGNDTRVPFLRGMLVKSLQGAGLEFVEAYNVATDLRDELEDGETAEVSTAELRDKIEEILAEDFPGKVLSRYKKEDLSRENLKVVSEDGSSDAFSRGIHVQRLQISTIPDALCSSITRKIHSYLVKNKIREIRTKELTALTYATIKQEVDQKHADFYLIWRDFLNESTPLLLLIGGIPGSGKSTIATEVANRLGIVRTQSTDMLREVMRILIPKKLSPALHTSSFSAGRKMQIPEKSNKAEDHMIYGFQMQSEMVEVASEAVIQRALNENVSMIVEGVHVRPSLLNRIDSEEAVVVPVCLAVLNRKRLVKFIKGRSSENKQRRAKRYLANIEDIWHLQEILVSEADNADIEIIDNHKINDTVSEIINIIIQTIATKYKGRIMSLRKKYA